MRARRASARPRNSEADVRNGSRVEGTDLEISSPALPLCSEPDSFQPASEEQGCLRCLAGTSPRTVLPWASHEAHSGLTPCSYCQFRPLGLCLDSAVYPKGMQARRRRSCWRLQDPALLPKPLLPNVNGGGGQGCQLSQAPL